MKKTKLLGLLAVIFIVLIGCTKPETPQNDGTNSTENTDFYIKAKVNSVWEIVKGDRCTYSLEDGNRLKIESYHLDGNSTERTNKTFSFSISSSDVGIYSFREKEDCIGSYIVGGNTYLTVDDGVVEITKFDNQAKIVEGKFSMNVKKNGLGEIIEIIEGTFRCKAKE